MCGLKLIESQLLASLAAANARSDAATLRAQRLSAALDTTATKLLLLPTTTQGAAAAGSGVHGGAAAGGDGGVFNSSSSSLAAEVAALQAQLLSRGQEVFDLRDQLMQAKQVSMFQGDCMGAYVCSFLTDSTNSSACLQAWLS